MPVSKRHQSPLAAHIANKSYDLHMEVMGSRGKYEITRTGDVWTCTCPAFKFGHGAPCKHIEHLEASLERYHCLICGAPWCNGDHSAKEETKDARS